VVNFELPNIPEDYVHRIGRTGRAGSNGEAISLVDSEEFSYLKSIERLIKREIPKVAIESFVPPTHIPADAPRPPRPQHGQRRHSNTTAVTGVRNGQRPPQQRDQTPRAGQPPRAGQSPRNATQPGNQAQQPQQKKNTETLLSEAARHQAMPQPGLFRPSAPPPRSGVRSSTGHGGGAGRGNTGRNSGGGRNGGGGGRGR
jgi:ATP-dependent RNA helicase RhlE